MKKIVCIMILACLVLSAAFAQKSSFGVDLFQLVKGFIASDDDSNYQVIIASGNYELLIAPHFSVGVDAAAYFINYKVGNDGKNGLFLNVAAEGRYYPMSENFEKFFLGTTVGFSSLQLDGSTNPKDAGGGFQGLICSLKAGYKLIMKGNIYLEPSMSYVLSKRGTKTIGSSVPTPLGWNGGLRFGIAF